MLDQNTHLYYDQAGREYKSVTTILKDEGLIRGFYKGDTARILGELCHQLTEAHDYQRRIISMPEECKPRLDQYRKFLKDTGFVPEFIEQELFNPLLNYAGRADRFGIMRGDYWCIDFKFSSASGMYWHEYQTAAYCMAAACNPKTKHYSKAKRAALIIRPDRYILVPHTKIANVETKWSALCIAHHAKREAGVIAQQEQEAEGW